MTCPCQKEIKQGKQVEFCSSHAFAFLFLLLSLLSLSPVFLYSFFVPPSLFLCGPPWYRSLRLLRCLCLVLPHPLLSLFLSTASLCSKYFLPSSTSVLFPFLRLHTLSSGHFLQTFPSSAFSFLTFLWSYLIWMFCTHWHTYKLFTYYAILLIPQSHFLFHVSYVAVVKTLVCIFCLKGSNLHTQHLKHCIEVGQDNTWLNI